MTYRLLEFPKTYDKRYSIEKFIGNMWVQHAEFSSLKDATEAYDRLNKYGAIYKILKEHK